MFLSIIFIILIVVLITGAVFYSTNWTEKQIQKDLDEYFKREMEEARERDAEIFKKENNDV